MNRTFSTYALMTVLCVQSAAGANNSGNSESSNRLTAKPEVVETWKDMRLGMFLCWGPVTLTGQEIGWSRGEPAWGRRPGIRGGKGSTPAEVYDKLYTRWNPNAFDARQWVRVAKEAGLNYMIFLVKHHDGFCLYDTALTDYKCTAPESAWQTDVMKEVADACREADLKLMLYYSQPDWHHPDYLTENHGRYVKYLHGQVRELLTQYGKIDGLWFDNLRPVKPETAALWDAEKLFRMARGLQPHLIINNRCGLPGDFDTPEQSLGGFQSDRPWESCITLGTQWSWKPDDKIKSLKACIDLLVTCAGRDGNIAINTNPMPNGEIEPRQAERFREIGQWLKKYGSSIYGTRGGPFRTESWGLKFGTTNQGTSEADGSWGVSTRKGNTIFLHILHWPGDTVELPPIDRKIVAWSVMTGGKATVRQTSQGIRISILPEDRDPLDTIVKVELDGPARDVMTGQ